MFSGSICLADMSCHLPASLSGCQHYSETKERKRPQLGRGQHQEPWELEMKVLIPTPPLRVMLLLKDNMLIS